jgi:hypothetical protein
VLQPLLLWLLICVSQISLPSEITPPFSEHTTTLTHKIIEVEADCESERLGRAELNERRSVRGRLEHVGEASITLNVRFGS